MRQELFLEKDDLGIVIADYEPPIIRVEEIVVERGFGDSNKDDPGGGIPSTGW